MRSVRIVVVDCELRHLLLVTAVRTCVTASKKKNLEAVEVLTSMTTLAAMTARKPMMFITRMQFRMM